MENKYAIYVLQSADKSLEGLTIDGWTIKVAHKTPLGVNDYLVPGIPLFPIFQKILGINKMLDIFHESFLTENKHLAFVLRIMILEMLIEGNAELSFRIARSVAVFLGKTEVESVQIHEICKKMYTARSKYLHDGITKGITEEMQRNALEISRRVIANLYFINEDISNIRETIYRGGYGANPYQVKF